MQELRRVITLMGIELDLVAQQHPSAIGLGAIVAGKACGVFCMVDSRGGMRHHSPVAPAKLRELATIIGYLPSELREVFEAELATVPRAEPVEEFNLAAI